jgi:ABC-type cobalamin/Fe3+-siderophores transport system ATPase subunit
LASVLAMNAPILALDEPAAGLDLATTLRLMDVVSARQLEGTTVVMITHDLWLAARYAQRVAVLHRGQLAALGSLDNVLTDVERLQAVDLEPLPVTILAGMLRFPSPLPLRVADFMAGLGYA